MFQPPKRKYGGLWVPGAGAPLTPSRERSRPIDVPASTSSWRTGLAASSRGGAEVCGAPRAECASSKPSTPEAARCALAGVGVALSVAAGAAPAATGAATATAGAASTTTRTAAAARRTILCFVDTERASLHRKAVQVLDGARGVGAVHFHERKSAGPARVAIHDDIHGLDSAVLREQSAHLALVSGKWQVSDIDFRHIT